MTDNDAQEVVEDVRAIKLLLMLQSLAMGFSQRQLASALGVSEATLSRMLPKGISKKVPRKDAKKDFSGVEVK